jgi:hypothetical protein
MRALLLCLILTSVSVSGCKKEIFDHHGSIHGLWIGTYLVNNLNQPEQYFSYIIKPDGTILVESKSPGKSYLAKGTWKLEGKNFSAEYTYLVCPEDAVGVSQTATATYDPKGKLKNGTWEDQYNTGTFKMEEVE